MESPMKIVQIEANWQFSAKLLVNFTPILPSKTGFLGLKPWASGSWTPGPPAPGVWSSDIESPVKMVQIENSLQNNMWILANKRVFLGFWIAKPMSSPARGMESPVDSAWYENLLWNYIRFYQFLANISLSRGTLCPPCPRTGYATDEDWRPASKNHIERDWRLRSSVFVFQIRVWESGKRRPNPGDLRPKTLISFDVLVIFDYEDFGIIAETSKKM